MDSTPTNGDGTPETGAQPAGGGATGDSVPPSGVALKSIAAYAVKEADTGKIVTGSPEQILDGGLMGVCVIFLSVLLSMRPARPHAFSHPLLEAVWAFAIALPCLGLGFIFNGLNYHPDRPLTNAWKSVAGALDNIGIFATFAGILAVLWYLDPRACLAPVGIFAVACISIPLVHARNIKHTRTAAQSTPSCMAEEERQ